MQVIPSAFRSDQIILTRWELIKLFFGQWVRDGATIVRVE